MGKLANVNIDNQYPLPTPWKILAEFPLSRTGANAVRRFRHEVEEIIFRQDKRLLAVIGPCSIDNVPAALEYAAKLAALQKKVTGRMRLVMRAYSEKPRTTAGWESIICDPDLNGSSHIEKWIRTARRLLLEINRLHLPAATEFLDSIIPQYIADLISWAATGARTVESQTHRQLASGLSMPVGFKSTTDGSIHVAADAVRTARAKHSFPGVIGDGRTGGFQIRGNPCCHVMLRGGQQRPHFGSANVACTVELMRKLGLTQAVMIACSHDNSRRDPHRQPEILREIVQPVRNGQNAICGVMLESYLATGSQEITPAGRTGPGLSVTDPCLGWRETEGAILASCDRLPPGRGAQVSTP